MEQSILPEMSSDENIKRLLNVVDVWYLFAHIRSEPSDVQVVAYPNFAARNEKPASLDALLKEMEVSDDELKQMFQVSNNQIVDSLLISDSEGWSQLAQRARKTIWCICVSGSDSSSEGLCVAVYFPEGKVEKTEHWTSFVQHPECGR